MIRDRSPIFIGGFYKSGTSLLRAMLGRHPSVASGLETTWFDMDWTGRRGPRNEPLEEYLEKCAAFYDLPVRDVSALSGSCHSVEEFLDAFLGEFTRRSGKRRWAEKTPGNIAHLKRIFTAWPQALVLHIIRDPRDVLASLYQTPKWNHPELPERFAEQWCSMLLALEEWKRSAPPCGDRLLEIRYESLILHPEETMRSVLEFIGEPWDAQVAHFDGQPGEYEKVLRVTGVASNTLERLAQPITTQRLQIWQSVLPPDLLAATETAIRLRGGGELYDGITQSTPWEQHD